MATGILENAFAEKATGTLSQRLSAWTLAGAWARQHLGTASLAPLQEAVLYSYFEDLRISRAPATRPQSFIDALFFA